MNLSTNSTSLLQICSDGGDGTSPHFMILVLAQLVLRPSLQAGTRTILGGMPMEWRMCHRQSRSTESNAALRSMKAMKSARSFRNSRAFSASNRMAEM